MWSDKVRIHTPFNLIPSIIKGWVIILLLDYNTFVMINCAGICQTFLDLWAENLNEFFHQEIFLGRSFEVLPSQLSSITHIKPCLYPAHPAVHLLCKPTGNSLYCTSFKLWPKWWLWYDITCLMLIWRLF